MSSEYDGQRKCIRLIFYEPNENKLYDWYDIEHKHKPYCLTNLSPMDLEKIPAIRKHPSIEKFGLIEKYDALQDKMIWVTKIITSDPQAIGGKRKGCIRNIIPSVCPYCFSKLDKIENEKKDKKDEYICPKCGIIKRAKVWEAKRKTIKRVNKAFFMTNLLGSCMPKMTRFMPKRWAFLSRNS